MKSFIESICLNAGELRNLELHQRRLDLTLLAHFGVSVRIDLGRELLHRALPASGLYKIRITYGKEITAIDIDLYTPRVIDRIEIVEADGLDYRYKYADRGALDAFRGLVAAGVQPILVQQGLVTDALYANVCFYDGGSRADDIRVGASPGTSMFPGRWLTPERPLLEGTARAAAIAAGEVTVAPVLAQEVKEGKYAMVKIINCMTPFSEAVPITVIK